MRKTALVYDWLISHGGAGKGLEAIYASYPGPVHTLVKKGDWFEEVKTSYIQKLPFATKLYRNYLPFFPHAIERFDFSGYDLILSSSHAVAKGVKKHAGQLHICYCHTPVRYAWGKKGAYLRDLRGAKKFLAKKVLHRLRKWDLES